MLQRHRGSVAARSPQKNAAIGRRVVVMVMLAGLAACGQKGPLTLTQPVPGAAASAPR